MNTSPAALALLLLSPAMLGAKAPTVGTAKVDTLDTLRGPKILFRWNVPCEFKVFEKRSKMMGKQEIKTELNYVVSVKPIEGSKNLRISFSKIEHTLVKGKELDEKARREKRAALATKMIMPSFEVTPKGEFVKIVDFKKMIDGIVAGLESKDGEEPLGDRVLRGVKRRLNHPMAEMQATGDTMDFWFYLVQSWVGRNIPSKKKPLDYALTMHWPNKVKVQGKASLTYLGKDAETKSHRLLSLSYTADPESAKEGMTTVIKSTMPPQMADRIPKDFITEVDYTVKSEASLHPKSLRMSSLKIEMKRKMSGKGMPLQEESETREMRFVWPQAAKKPKK